MITKREKVILVLIIIIVLILTVIAVPGLLEPFRMLITGNYRGSSYLFNIQEDDPIIDLIFFIREFFIK